MSVQTAADDYLEDAANHIAAAVVALDEIVIKECEGHDGFGKATLDEIQNALWRLVELRGTPTMAVYRNRTGRTSTAGGY